MSSKGAVDERFFFGLSLFVHAPLLDTYMPCMLLLLFPIAFHGGYDVCVLYTWMSYDSVLENRAIRCMCWILLCLSLCKQTHKTVDRLLFPSMYRIEDVQ